MDHQGLFPTARPDQYMCRFQLGELDRQDLKSLIILVFTVPNDPISSGGKLDRLEQLHKRFGLANNAQNICFSMPYLSHHVGYTV